MWSAHQLKFVVGNNPPRTRFQRRLAQHRNREEDEPPTGSMQDLKEFLKMGRLNALQQLTLDFLSHVSWQDCIHLLETIPPSVRKLSLKRLNLVEPLPSIHVLAERLVAKLVKFEEVNFGIRSHGFLDVPGIVNAILRRLAAVGTSREDSKLKVLSLPSCWRCKTLVSVKALAEARKILTVNILRTQHSLQAGWWNG